MSAAFDLSWSDLTKVMFIVAFVVSISTFVYTVLAKRMSPRSPAEPQLQLLERHQRHYYVAVLMMFVPYTVLMILWLVWSAAALPLMKPLIACGVVGMLYFIIVLIARASVQSSAFGSQQSKPVPVSDPALQTGLVARIALRFCPRCRASLATDAPEGLCPACLMAGGRESILAIDPAGGMALTTPPSGSRSPTTGEWIDLAQHFPQLEILELLGRGGMGAVYKARQKHLDRFVALKVIPPLAAKDPAFAERFAREARALARLNHPNVVTVYDFGQTGGVFYLLMEYVDGLNLRHAQQASRLTPSEALAVVPQICDALQYAHDQGVIHRDIKPENILLDRGGRVKIADFGLAKMLGKGPDDFTLTGTQQVLGTPRYMAPEQIEKPSTVDHRADIYSLGVVIYEMLTGELPLGRFQPPSHKVQVDVRIDEVVLRTLEKEPERRYQRASQVKTELASAGSGLTPAMQFPAQAIRPGWSDPVAPPPKTAAADTPLLATTLLIAFGIQVGLLLISGGLAAVLYGSMAHPVFGDKFWGWSAAAVGCLLGGFGCLLGCYAKYRQHAGLERLERSPRFTWFDRVQAVQITLGVAFLFSGGGLYLVDYNITDSSFALLSMGIAAVLPAGIMLARRRRFLTPPRHMSLAHKLTARGPMMAIMTASRHCATCGCESLHAREYFSDGWGLLFTVLTGGAFIPLWLLIKVWEAISRPWRCQDCGRARLV